MSNRYFVTDPPVPVPEDVFGDVSPNVIWVKSRMDVETRGRVRNEIIALSGTNDGNPGHSETALLICNIVRWEGPDLDGVPCDAAHIRTLDPTEPHLIRVLNVIGERNAPKVAPNPKSVTSSISANAGASDSTASPQRAELPSHLLASGTQRLRSPSDSVGDLNRSGD